MRSLLRDDRVRSMVALAAVVSALVLLSSCAAGPNPAAGKGEAGFWSGLWAHLWPL